MNTHGVAIIEPTAGLAGGLGLPEGAEHLLQNRAAAPDRVLANLSFFLADHEVEAVERAGDVVLEVRVFLLHQAEARGLAGDLVVLVGELTLSVAAVTTGRKRSVSCARVCPRKTPLPRCRRQSERLSHRSRSWCARRGPADPRGGYRCSAARFMAVTSSSSGWPCPSCAATRCHPLKNRATECAPWGSPESRRGGPASPTAESTPFSSAALSP